MEESFELLSSMSPKVKGRQKTVKVKKASKLALKKHFRRSIIFDKSLIKNEDLALVELSTETSESIASSKEFGQNDKKDINDIVIIDSSDSEDEQEKRPKTNSSYFVLNNENKSKNKMIKKWVNNIEECKKRDTYFSQVSTIFGDDPPNINNDCIAACSSFDDCLSQRFDELFINKINDIKVQSKEDTLSDDSFSLGLSTSLTSKLNKLGSSRSSISEKSLSVKEKNENHIDLIDETLLTSDESIVKMSPNESPKKLPLKSTPKNGECVWKKNDIKVQSKEDALSDDSFSLGLSTSLTSKLNKLGSSRNSISEKSLSVKEKNENHIAIDLIDKTLLTSDEIIVKISSKESPKRSPLKSTPKNGAFVSVRKKNDKKSSPECAKTPLSQSVKEAESMLDSIYGKSWRKKQENVLLPMSEPKKKQTNNKKDLAPNSVRILKPSIKENMLNNVNIATRKLNFDKLKKPVQSPWVQRLKGLVDSDSDSNRENSDLENNISKPKGIEMVKIRLDFNEDSPADNIVKAKKKTSITNTDKASNILPKKPDNNTNCLDIRNVKINKKIRSRSISSTNSCDEEDISTDEEYDKEVQILEIKRKSMLPAKVKTYSFLESLSASIPINKCDMSARIFRTGFKQHREALAMKLLTFFNEKVFENALPKDTELEWNDKLTKTAGLCYCKKITHRNGNVERKVRIALSTKVLDSPDRLRDTLIHEMCHAATWIVNKVSDGHGAYWKNWAFKAMEAFPELPPIKRCHTYTINSKYTYRCLGCGYRPLDLKVSTMEFPHDLCANTQRNNHLFFFGEIRLLTLFQIQWRKTQKIIQKNSFGRHSKSLDTERKRCGHCYGKFEVLLNKVTRKGETKTVAVTARKEATGFALFVKENYALYKNPTKKHGDVMKVLSQKFAEFKVAKNTS